MKSRIPTEEFGLWDYLTFSTVQNLSCADAQGMLASATHNV